MSGDAKFILTEDDKKIPPADLALAKRVAECLHRHYPRWLWYVNAEHAQGIVQIQCGELSMFDQMGYVLHIDKIDQGLLAVMRAGGEILERYNQLRAKMPDRIGEQGYVRITPDA